MGNADKRSVSTDALETLGTIIGDGQGRDAIHLAVEPVIAGQYLEVGEDVGFLPDGSVGICDKPVGIVDPFLKAPVQRGQKFWLIVYPRQITSLRHVWTHPAFADAIVPKTPDRKAESEAWLRHFCEMHNCPSYGHVMELIEKGRMEEDDGESFIDEEYMHFSCSDAHGKIPPEFWDHVENVLGRKVSNRPAYFSCSC